MRIWTQLLDDYEATVVVFEAAVERADASGGEAPTLVWEPPEAVPTVAPTRAEQARHRQLQARADACSHAIRTRLVAAAADLDVLRRTGAAARAYGSLG